MSKIKIMVITAFVLVVFTECYDREIIDRKDFNHTLPKVENLTISKQEDAVTLSWQIPDNISADFVRPLETSIQVIENDIYRQIVSVLDEENSAKITIESNKKYRFVVKLLGYLTSEAKSEGFTDKVFSDGVIIEVQ